MTPSTPSPEREESGRAAARAMNDLAAAFRELIETLPPDTRRRAQALMRRDPSLGWLDAAVILENEIRAGSPQP